jgi:transposase
MASDEPLQRSWSSTCVFAPRMLRLVISAGSSDAVWLCKVAERQMLRPSFVPPRPLRQLRDPTRYRIDLVGAGPRRSSGLRNCSRTPASSCRWSPATSYLRGLRPGDAGCSDRWETRPRGSRGHGLGPDARQDPAVARGFHRALRRPPPGSCWPRCWPESTGSTPTSPPWTPRSRRTWPLSPRTRCGSMRSQASGPVAAAVIIAEIGVDMTRFPTRGHLCSWAKFAPA